MEKKNHAYKFSRKLKEKCNARWQNVCEAVRAAETRQRTLRRDGKTERGWHTSNGPAQERPAGRQFLKEKDSTRSVELPLFSAWVQNIEKAGLMSGARWGQSGRMHSLWGTRRANLCLWLWKATPPHPSLSPLHCRPCSHSGICADT